MKNIKCEKFSATISEKACGINCNMAARALQQYKEACANGEHLKLHKIDETCLNRLMVCSTCKRAFSLLISSFKSKEAATEEVMKLIDQIENTDARPTGDYDRARRLRRLQMERYRAGLKGEEVPDTNSKEVRAIKSELQWLSPSDIHDGGTRGWTSGPGSIRGALIGAT